MSYDFSPATSSIKGVFSGTHGQALTLAAWTKYTTHPVSADWILALSAAAAQNPHISLQYAAVDDRFIAASQTATSDAAIETGSAAQWDGVWVPVVGVFTGDSDRDVYVELISQTGNDTGTQAVGTALDEIHIGRAPNGAGGNVDHIAEPAIWDKALSTAEITAYLNGNAAVGIANANLLGYWPLDVDNASQTDQSGNGGPTLTVANATFAADHPTITSGGNPWYYYANQ